MGAVAGGAAERLGPNASSVGCFVLGYELVTPGAAVEDMVVIKRHCTAAMIVGPNVGAVGYGTVDARSVPGPHAGAVGLVQLGQVAALGAGQGRAGANGRLRCETARNVR